MFDMAITQILPMYFEAGKDQNRLTLYCCCRGTNYVEGGVHQNLIRRFTSFNVSPLLVLTTCR
jgi:hypothetical protein